MSTLSEPVSAVLNFLAARGDNEEDHHPPVYIPSVAGAATLDPAAHHEPVTVPVENARLRENVPGGARIHLGEASRGVVRH